MHGNVRTAILLTFAHIGLDVRILNDWYETRGLVEPWGTLSKIPRTTGSDSTWPSRTGP